MSLSELARESGIAKATLSKLEAGEANPTLDTLWALAKALHISLGELLTQRSKPITVVRAGEMVPIEGKAFRADLIHGLDITAARVELFHGELHRGKQAGPEQGHGPGVVEHVYVISGHIRVGTGDLEVELKSGDYIRLEADRSHHYVGLRDKNQLFVIMEYPRQVTQETRAEIT